MEGVPDGQPTIVVRILGWTGFGSPKVDVFIDGRPAGILSDRRARSLPVTAGGHEVAARVGFLRSRPLALSLAPGERASLECGFYRWQLALAVALFAASGAALLLLSLGSFGQATAVLVVAQVVMAIDLLIAIAIPGVRFYLRRSAVPVDAGAMPERMDAPSPGALPEPGRRGFQISLKGLLILVACCAPLLWGARELWDLRPENRPARALRMIQSEYPGTRLSGANDLRMFRDDLTPKQLDAAILALLVALRDRDTGVREAAAVSLFVIVVNATQRSVAVPRVQAVAAGLAEGMRDTVPAVQHHTGLALVNIYPLITGTGRPQAPLPVDTERFVASLGQALENPNPDIRGWASHVLYSIAPRLKQSAPARLLAAPVAPDAATRREAVDAVVASPVGIDPALPAMLRVLERGTDPGARMFCSWTLEGVRPSPVSVPVLREALRSPERSVRFLAADLLGRIGRRASEAVPALLPLLEETFEPVTPSGRQIPGLADPAVAAARALGAIAPGTDMADAARAALEKLLRRPGHPWRDRDAVEALGRLNPALLPDEPGSSPGKSPPSL